MELYCFKKKYLIFLLLLLSVNFYANERDLFSFSVSKKIKLIEGKENKKIIKLFLKKWKSNSFSENDKDIIVHYVSDFENRTFNQDYYIDFFSFCNYLIDINPNKLSNWLSLSVSSINSLSDYELKLFLQTNRRIIKKNILFEMDDFSWSFSGEFSLFFRDNKPYYSLNLDSLILSNDYNQIVIYNTQGEFNMISKVFEAKGGYVGWERIDIPIDNRRVLLGTYELDFTNRKINFEDVVLENNLHFTINSQGRFIDYLSRAKKQNSYPKFYATEESQTGTFFGGFSCTGLVSIIKDKVYFKSKDNEFVKLIYNNDDFSGEFVCQSISLKDSSLSSGKVSSKFFFNENKDSIFHPEMRMSYDHDNKQILFNRLNNTYLSDRPILNSYHALNIYADILKVNLEQKNMFILSTCVANKNYILFESLDYYNNSRYKDLDFSSSNMLDILLIYINNYEKRNKVSVYDFALHMDMSFESALHVIKTLEIFDFVNYDSFSEKFDIKNRAFHFYDSKNKQYDFDQLSVESSCFLGDVISVIDLNDLTMRISNVKKINFQFEPNYNLDLIDKEIVFYKNRDFIMNANISFENFNIKSDSVVFNYNDFLLFYPKYSDFEIINKNIEKSSESIENIVFKNGFLELDSLSNKSGIIDNYDFPKFHFSDSTFIFGNDNAIVLNIDPMIINYFDEIALDNLTFNGNLSMENAFESISGDLTLNKLSGLNFNSNGFNLPFFDKDSLQGNFNFSDSELRFSGELKNSNFSYISNNMFVNSSMISSRNGDLIFNSNSPFVSLEGNNVSMQYVLSDSVKFSLKNKRLFSLYDEYNFFGEIILDFKIEDMYLSASGNFISNKNKDLSFNIFSDLFLFSKDSFISANSNITFNSIGNKKFNLNGVSLEFNIKSDSVFLFRESLNFNISFLNADLDFQASLFDVKSRKLKFFNFDDSQGFFTFNDKFSYQIDSVNYDFFSQKFSLNTNNYLFFGDYKLIPKNGFFEINNDAIPYDFVAKKIIKKRLGKDLIYLDKIVSFDKKLNCFIKE